MRGRFNHGYAPHENIFVRLVCVTHAPVGFRSSPAMPCTRVPRLAQQIPPVARFSRYGRHSPRRRQAEACRMHKSAPLSPHLHHAYPPSVGAHRPEHDRRSCPVPVARRARPSGRLWMQALCGPTQRASHWSRSCACLQSVHQSPDQASAAARWSSRLTSCGLRGMQSFEEKNYVFPFSSDGRQAVRRASRAFPRP